ncbi:hypothetical protein [Desulfomarina sp.]
MAAIIHKHTFAISVCAARDNLLQLSEKISECFWLSLSLLLFVIMGPFAAPVVLLVLFQLAREENGCVEPEPLGEDRPGW